jgi:hypothetical protein
VTGFNTVAMVSVAAAAVGCVAGYALVRRWDFVGAVDPAVASPASPATGVYTITGQGLAEVVVDADVVVDVSNAPVWDDDAVIEFFTTSSRNLLVPRATLASAITSPSRSGDFVSSLAHRIARFPTAGQVVVKERVNAITLAAVEDFRRDSDLFLEGVRTPESQGLIQAAMKRGFQTRDAELALARMLGDLAGP